MRDLFRLNNTENNEQLQVGEHDKGRCSGRAPHDVAGTRCVPHGPEAIRPGHDRDVI